jgi:hypothetical protein
MSAIAHCNRLADPGIEGCGAIRYAEMSATSGRLDEP